MYNFVSTNIDTKAFHGWRLDQHSSQEDTVSHKSPDLPSIFSDDSNDARTDEKNKADENHKHIEEKHTTAPMVPIKKNVPLALIRLIDCYSLGPFYEI